MQKTALITGITGQDGSYLAEFLLEKGYKVHGTHRRSSISNMGRIEHLLDKITLHDGDKMLVSNLFYTPKAGDIVVFKTDNYDPDRALVKRVIATEGQDISIDFDRGIVYINGVPKEEDYIAELTKTKLDFIGPQTVPEGCVFVMGDNRNASTDSRKKEIGMVDRRMILGRAYYVIFPISEMGWIT